MEDVQPLTHERAARWLTEFAATMHGRNSELIRALRMGADALREVDRLESRDQQLSRHVIQLDAAGALLAEENDRLTARVVEWQSHHRTVGDAFDEASRIADSGMPDAHRRAWDLIADAFTDANQPAQPTA